VEITRTIDVARPLDDVWVVVTGRRWLGEPAGDGVVHTDDGRRHMEVTETDPPRRWAFAWWPAGQPLERTDVVVELEPTETGTTTVTVTETIPDRRVTDRPGGGETRALALAGT
jgi:uncharacterized protein YndB with AHSA1/START domain